MVVKKTLRNSNGFFYNHVCRTSVFWGVIMDSGEKDNRLTPTVFNASKFYKSIGSANA